MIKLTTKSTFVIAAFALSSIVGCAGRPYDVDEKDENNAAIDASEGALTIVDRSETRVAGSFVREGVTLQFTFSRRGSDHEVILANAAGSPLLTSKLTDGIESMRILDRVTVSGSPDSTEPRVEGDQEAIRELNELKEMKLVEPLRTALGKNGIDRELYAPTNAKAIAPKLASMNQWVWLGCYGQAWFPTWSFWYWTNVIVSNKSYSYTSKFRMLGSFGTYEDQVLSQGQTQVYPRQYWGYPMGVNNVCWGSGPATIAVYVY
jgi:hypothetical protein